jgi:hypothetical protein
MTKMFPMQAFSLRDAFSSNSESYPSSSSRNTIDSRFVFLLALTTASVFLFKAPIGVVFDLVFLTLGSFASKPSFDFASFASFLSAMFISLTDYLIGLVTYGRAFFLNGFLSTEDIFFGLIGSRENLSASFLAFLLAFLSSIFLVSSPIFYY